MILNYGEVASSLYDWSISVIIDGDRVVGQIPMSSGKDVVMQINKDNKATYRKEDRWSDRAISPIEAGGSLGGWISAVFVGLERDMLYKKPSSVVLGFRDVVTGELHEITKQLSSCAPDMDDPNNPIYLAI